jgi:hypothetical protein
MTPVIVLMLLSAGLIAVLGLAHLVITFTGNKLLPRKTSLRDAMMADSPVITRQTTMWRAWLGFNASHSMGALLFGLVYGYLAVVYPAVLFQSVFLVVLGFVFLGGYLVLARRYWFRTPLAGISLSLACYTGSILLSVA